MVCLGESSSTDIIPWVTVRIDTDITPLRPRFMSIWGEPINSAPYIAFYPFYPAKKYINTYSKPEKIKRRVLQYRAKW